VSVLPQVDHLIFATPDVSAGVDSVERVIGVRATPGGQHPGQGTRNALIALGPACYLEIIGPDSAQPAPPAPRWFGIDDLRAPRLVTWAAHGTSLERFAADAKARGVDPGAVSEGGRRRADGVALRWTVTNPRAMLGDGLVPFFIDWASSPHPSTTAAAGATLVDLRAEHPAADRVQAMLSAFGVSLDVTRGRTPVLIATIDGPKGRVELR
jgi:hypothetical protein